MYGATKFQVFQLTLFSNPQQTPTTVSRAVSIQTYISSFNFNLSLVQTPLIQMELDVHQIKSKVNG